VKIALLLSAWLVAAPLAAAPIKVSLSENASSIAVTVGGKPFTEFFFKGATKPYMHPLRTASGKTLTRLYPMENVAGEKKDHLHHRGLWFSHGDVNGWDFWANEESQKGVGKGRGTISATGPVKAGRGRGFSSRFEWKAGDGTALLSDVRSIGFDGSDTTRIIRLSIALTALTDVTFGDTKEGTFALRLRDELTEEKSGTMRNAEGAEKEKNVWGKSSPWVDYSGVLDGESVGVAILDHPSNPRHPTTWHSRGYGLFAANIFGLRDFTRDKSKDGALKLAKGEQLMFRYQVVIHNGAKPDIRAIYDAWAKN
jgi:hypothetical protein